MIAVVLGIVGMFTFYRVRQDRRQEALRQQMLDLHATQLTEISEQYLGFRRRIESLVLEAVEGGEPEPFSRVNISGLRSGEGIYLRIHAQNAEDPEVIRSAALGMEPDAITRCLGLSPASVRGLYEKGEFLTPEWVDTVRDEPDMMALRVLDDQLGRHIQVDAPVVLSMMQADWFLLVVQQGENRREHPVDVFLWDLRRNQQLLAARIQGRGLLVPVRIRFEGVNPGRAPGAPAARSGGANDCSIASQLRAMGGAGTLEFESGEQVDAAAGRAAEEAAERAAEAEAAEAAAAEASAEGEGVEDPEASAEP